MPRSDSASDSSASLRTGASAAADESSRVPGKKLRRRDLRPGQKGAVRAARTFHPLEVSLLQELDDSVREGQPRLASDTVPASARLSFEARFELLGRRTILWFAAAEAEQEWQELERSILDLDLDYDGDDTSDWYEDDEE